MTQRPRMTSSSLQLGPGTSTESKHNSMQDGTEPGPVFTQHKIVIPNKFQAGNTKDHFTNKKPKCAPSVTAVAAYL
jgi:hypothetical protein